MNKRFAFSLWSGLLVFGLFLASAWTYWNEQSSGDAWVVEHPEKVAYGAALGEKLHVAFILRNTASQPLRVLGVEAC